MKHLANMCGMRASRTRDWIAIRDSGSTHPYSRVRFHWLGCRCSLDWAHFDVVGGGVVFGAVIVDSLEPVDAEVAFGDPILGPVKSMSIALERLILFVC